MDKLAYFQGYQKIAASPMSLENLKRTVLDDMSPSPASLAGHIGNRAVDWFKANPEKAILLAGLLGGGIAGGALGEKKFMPVNRPTGKPILKGIAAGTAAAGGAIAYQNRDKIAEFFRNMKTKFNV